MFDVRQLTIPWSLDPDDGRIYDADDLEVCELFSRGQGQRQEDAWTAALIELAPEMFQALVDTAIARRVQDRAIEIYREVK